jgi:hypothetical protein
MAGEGSEVTRGILFFGRSSLPQFELTQQIGLMLAWISAYSSLNLSQDAPSAPFISSYSGEVVRDLWQA